MKRYNIINNALGWLCFFIAALTYILTLEPTASFWDCPEFILQGAKLEVGHPPGNPIFMLAARFFITLFGGGMTTAALAVNTMSALLSAGTILLLFWSVTHLVKKLLVADDATEVSWWKTLVIMAGGICGALAYTWSDTFWFSAVEGEVYAFSSFCTALVFWLMLKWENRADQPHSDRYLILIAYVIGVSIAVHLLNLLCIPALGLIFYYRKWRNANAKGSLIALAISCVIVAAILYGLVPGFIQVAQWFELLFVNGLGMSYNMGVLIYAILLVTVFILAIKALYSAKNPGKVRFLFWLSIALSGMPFIGHSAWIGAIVLAALAVYLWGFCRKIPVRIFTLIVLSIFVIFVGYASYALLLIRASANTPMNQNAPDNVFALASYLNREQYGERPLFKGPVFAEALMEEEYPQGSGSYFTLVDEYGRPKTQTIDGYLRDERGAAFNTPTFVYSKKVKTNPDEPDQYVKEIERPSYKTVPDLDMIFTRIYSNDPEGRHVSGYKSWSGYTTPDINYIPQDVRKKWADQGFAPSYEVMQYLPNMQPVTTAVYSNGEPAQTKMVWKPGFDTNLSYFINYQLNHMYWRYFMWNFAGRQNDLQGNGEPHLGNWISGIPFIDNARLGNQEYLPDDYGKGNKGHNVFYMLPLILGLIGLLWQALYNHRLHPMRGIQQFWVVFFLFFMTGVAIVLYLNQTPGQPRERDYAFAGSFYAYAIWIGIGVPAIAVMLRNLFTPKKKTDEESESKPSKGVDVATAALACIVALGVPLQMVSQTWDDHDRSGRYTTRDYGFNYLASLDDNAIIFTNGDNDTFPLWYAQEVEGFRPDVRVVNLSYLTTDWYANQMKLPTAGAEGIPFLAQPKDYAYERLGYSFVLPKDTNPTPAKDALTDLYASDASTYGAPILSKPNMFIPVDREFAMSRYSTGIAGSDSLMLPSLGNIKADFSRTSGLNQSKVLSLDMIANSVSDNWNRPAYFATTVPESYYLGLTPYLSAAGMAYEVTPFNTPAYNATADKSYARIIKDFRWGGLDAPDAEDLYLDETVRRMAASVRSGVTTVVENLMMTGNAPAPEVARKAAQDAGVEVPETHYDMARQLIDLIVEKVPVTLVPYNGYDGLSLTRYYLDLYLATGNKADLEKAQTMAAGQADTFAQLVKYASTLDPVRVKSLGRAELYGIQFLGEALALQNYAQVLAELPEASQEEKDIIAGTDLDANLRIAPILFIDGYTLDDLKVQREKFPANQRDLIDRVIGIMELNQKAGIQVDAFAKNLMMERGFTPQDWNLLLN